MLLYLQEEFPFMSQQKNILTMKIIYSILCTLLLHLSASSQDLRNRCGDVFLKEKYPTDSFRVQEKVYNFHQTQIIFTLLQYKYHNGNSDFCQIWVQQRKGKKVLKSYFLGENDGESGVQLPAVQPFKGYFILNKAGEFTGTFYLINRKGNWIEIPGAALLSNSEKTTLFTYVPVECGGCTIGRFDLKTQQLTTKDWDGEGRAWEEVTDMDILLDLFEKGELLK